MEGDDERVYVPPCLEERLMLPSCITTSSVPSKEFLEWFCISLILGESSRMSGLVTACTLDSFVLKVCEERSFWSKHFAISTNLDQKQLAVLLWLKAGQCE